MGVTTQEMLTVGITDKETLSLGASTFQNSAWFSKLGRLKESGLKTLKSSGFSNKDGKQNRLDYLETT